MTLPKKSEELKSLYIIGGVAALLQLATLFAMAIVMAALGAKPTSAEGYFILQQSSELEMVLRGDFLTLILIGLYLGTFPALYAALRRVRPVYTALATLFTLIAVTLAFGSESTFSLLHLGNQYRAILQLPFYGVSRISDGLFVVCLLTSGCYFGTLL